MNEIIWMDRRSHPMKVAARAEIRVSRRVLANLGVSRATVERLVNRGELPIVKVAGSTRYDVEDLDDYIEINRCRNRRRTA
jgi:excisionase family DNA binding protein